MAKINFRQGIVKHQSDNNNNPTFLQKRGQFVTLVVAPDPTIVAFVHGTKDYLFTESVTQPDAWGPFVVGVSEWLYWDLNRITGVRTFGSTEYEPIKSPKAPHKPTNDQHWFNTTTNMWYVWSGLAWSEVIRVFTAQMILGTTLSSVSSMMPLYIGTQVGLVTPRVMGALVFDSTGHPILDGNRKFFTTEDKFTTGVPTGAALKINDVTMSATALQPIGACSVVTYSGYHHVIPAKPYSVVNKIYGIVESGANTNDIVDIVTTGRIFSAAWDWTALNAKMGDAVYINDTGEIVLTPVYVDSLPVGAVVGRQTIIFNPTLYGTSGVKGGITSHGDLIDVDGDDHTQYLTTKRGDARYYTTVDVDTNFAPIDHVHTTSDVETAIDKNNALVDIQIALPGKVQQYTGDIIGPSTVVGDRYHVSAMNRMFVSVGGVVSDTASVVVDINVTTPSTNTTRPIGSVTFLMGESVGTGSLLADISLLPGDRLHLTKSRDVDSGISDVVVVLKGNKQ